MGRIRGRIGDLNYDIEARLRYSLDPDLGLSEWATRDDVRRVRHLVPLVRGIGPVRLAQLDQWLDADVTLPTDILTRGADQNPPERQALNRPSVS